MRTTLFVLLTALAIPLPAQIEADPRAKMQELLDAVADEMKQIDKWLQESSRSKDAAKAMEKNVSRLNKLLDHVVKSQEQVVKGIDELLKEAQKLKGKDGQGDGC